MKTETEIERELQEVRKLLAQEPAESEDPEFEFLYGAQQALGWVLHSILRSPSQMEKVIQQAADALQKEDP